MNDEYLPHRARYAPTDHGTLISDSSTSLRSQLLAGLVLVYVVFKSLELLGYPVWLWLQIAVDMASQTTSVPIRLPRFPSSFLLGTSGEEPGADDDTQKQTGHILGTLFGFNRNGFVRSGKGSSDVPPGLINLHASCFENSVVQGLASLPSLQDYLSHTTSEYEALDLRTTNGALFDCITGLNDTEHGRQYFKVPHNLHFLSVTQHQDAQEYYSKILEALDKEVHVQSSSKNRSGQSWSLFAKQLLNLPTAAAELGSPENNHSQVDGGPPEEQPKDQDQDIDTESRPKADPNPLSGLIAQRVACTGCGYSEGLTLSEFNCLTVHLGTDIYRDYDIRDCLDEYSRVERINGVQCTKCTLLRNKKILSNLLEKPMADDSRIRFETRLKNVQEALDEDDLEDSTLTQKCGIAKKNRTESTKTKQQVIARAPKSLALHVNRSVVDERTFNIVKNHANVMFPKELDLGPWCLGSRPSKSQGNDGEVEEWPNDPNESLIADMNVDPKDMKTSSFRYALRAVVTHRGQHGSGHYVCFRNTGQLPSTHRDVDSMDVAGGFDQWWLFDDETVYPRSTKDVLAQGNVFMLFYERIDPSPSVSLDFLNATKIAKLPPIEVVAQIPLPDDNSDDFLLTPPESPILRPTSHNNPPILRGGFGEPESPGSIYPTPPPDESGTTTFISASASASASTSTDYPPSELESDADVSVTTDTDTSELETIPTTIFPPTKPPTPRHMRTAGDSPMRGEGGRAASLPMVTA
ncbi:cysteine proteinase [Lindgomyces ingoldianus]|uniref:Cysteine proteinase n=1 Tax=Lindgomyces ingoldianus TaxID=673940 RepID=A0ACB6QGT1_9PLEO|nr:cysteine proteinase [Lindgomyces ingoldianus]KAF2466097.1 cysteine proteinase [Lindgomyces ingoldianus]